MAKGFSLFFKTFLVFVCVISFNMAASSKNPDEQKLGLPKFLDIVSLSDVDQFQATVKSGQPLILQFWASWCHSCGSVMWDLHDIVKQYPNTQYLSISIDDNRQTALNAIQQHQLYKKHSERYFIDANEQLTNWFAIKTVPTILFINADGKVVHRHSGHINSEDLFIFKKLL